MTVCEGVARRRGIVRSLRTPALIIDNSVSESGTIRLSLCHANLSACQPWQRRSGTLWSPGLIRAFRLVCKHVLVAKTVNRGVEHRNMAQVSKPLLISKMVAWWPSAILDLLYAYVGPSTKSILVFQSLVRTEISVPNVDVCGYFRQFWGVSLGEIIQKEQTRYQCIDWRPAKCAFLRRQPVSRPYIS